MSAALARPGTVRALFVTDRAHPMVTLAGDSSVPVAQVSDKAAAALSQTTSPQGVVAVCAAVDVELAAVLTRRPQLVAVVVEPNDPGNAGTIVRTADAVGADAVIFAGGGVDPYNGKVVRASAGSLFHVNLVIAPAAEQVYAQLRAAGLTVLASSGAGTDDVFELAAAGELLRPHAWVFGTEAHGLAPKLLSGADRTVRVPIRGRAESLNLAAAAAVCLYASIRPAGGPVATAPIP